MLRKSRHLYFENNILNQICFGGQAACSASLAYQKSEKWAEKFTTWHALNKASGSSFKWSWSPSGVSSSNFIVYSLICICNEPMWLSTILRAFWHNTRETPGLLTALVYLNEKMWPYSYQWLHAPTLWSTCVRDSVAILHSLARRQLSQLVLTHSWLSRVWSDNMRKTGFRSQHETLVWKCFPG